MVRATGRGKYDRSKTSEERRHERIELVLDQATEVFAERGYRATRVDDIVERAGMSRRTFYEMFDSVEAILEQVYDRAVRVNLGAIVQRVMTVSDPIERVHVGVAAYYEAIANNPAAARVVFDQYRHAGPAQAARYELNRSRYATLMLEVLSAAHVAGRLAHRPDELSVYALLRGIEGVGVRALDRKEHAQLAAMAPVMSRLMLQAFGVRSG